MPNTDSFFGFIYCVRGVHLARYCLRRLYKCLVNLGIRNHVNSLPTLPLILKHFEKRSMNLYDMAPQYAGMMMGFVNTFGTIPGMISPVVTGYVVQNQVSIHNL